MISLYVYNMSHCAGWNSRGISDKQEGMAVINACVVALGADNDFGIGSSGPATMTLVQLPSCLTKYDKAAYAAAYTCDN